MQELLRQLPKVDQLLDEPEIKAMLDGGSPRRLVLKAVRLTIDRLRKKILENPQNPPDLDRESVLALIREKFAEIDRPLFRRVVNGTGVVIHTNLGRSLLSEEALSAVLEGARHYSNLEFDLTSGRRGSRYSHVEEILCDLTGAEAALVVNNNAAAVLICLNTLALGREVIVSRGELVEIGGAFRIPDVRAWSGARLVEVGATNKTHPEDYEQAVTSETALLLKVHQSNFKITGFTSQVEAVDLAAMARRLGLAVMEDLGSGSLVDFSKFGLRREPTVQETVHSGVDVTTISGDKLLGGPQAGIILGRKDIVERIKKNPLNRAVRIDKFTLAALEATLRLYLDEPRALERIPTLRMIAAPFRTLSRRASRLKRIIEKAAGPEYEVFLTEGHSRIGGGALPELGLKTRLVCLRPKKISVNQLEERLRAQPRPIIGRIENDAFVLDVRTMDDAEFEPTAEALARAVADGDQ